MRQRRAAAASSAWMAAAAVLLAVVALAAITTEVSGESVDRRSSCPYDCQNGGRCVRSACKCKLGFVGIDCSRRGCNSNCHHRGYCDLSSTPPSCLCFPSWAGLTCEISVDEAQARARPANRTATGKTIVAADGTVTVVDGSNSTDAAPRKKPLDRALCNPECHPVHGVCWQGACACAAGFTGPSCSDRLCPADCSARGKCHKRTGQCECYRPYSGPTCAGASHEVRPRPVDTMADVAGPHHTANSTTNALNRNKLGLSTSFHLVEATTKNNTNTDSSEFKLFSQSLTPE